MKSLLTISCLLVPSIGFAANTLTVYVTNSLPVARADQTIELSARDLQDLGESDLRKIHISDVAGRERLCQAADTDADAYRAPDIVLFQSDFAPGETRVFKVRSGARQAYTKSDFRACGRFVRERFDDFAWENDRIAHRMYGKALETWKGEPLTSSAVDIWSKRVPYPVVDDWYRVDNYHTDTGEGCDVYSAGSSRGCGGAGFWASNKLWVSRNFAESRVLANGPIRVQFELVYEPFEVDGIMVSETKRITLDAGSQLDRFESVCQVVSDRSAALKPAIGFKKVNGSKVEFDPQRGWLIIWEPMAKNMGMQGLAAIVDTNAVDRLAEDNLNHLLLGKSAAGNQFSYWAGFCWNKAGRIATPEAWKEYVDQFARGLGGPLQVTVSSE